jgi:hypothetical protein
MKHNQQFVENKDPGAFAEAIVDTVREPVIVLDKDLRVLAASRSFYLTFKVTRANTQDRPFYAGRWSMGHSEASVAPGKNRAGARITRSSTSFPTSEDASCC